MSRPLDPNRPYRDQQIVAQILEGVSRQELRRQWSCGDGVLARLDKLVVNVRSMLDRGKCKDDIVRDLNCTGMVVDMVRGKSPEYIKTIMTKGRKVTTIDPIDTAHVSMGQAIRWLYDGVVTQSEFALMASMTDLRLRQITSGTHSPTLAETESLAEALGLGVVAEEMTVNATRSLASKLRVPVDRLKEDAPEIVWSRMRITAEEVLRKHLRDKSGMLNVTIRKTVTDHLKKKKEELIEQRK